jgi:hypothetical protein
MMRVTGNDDTGEAGHAKGCRDGDALSIKCTVTVIAEARQVGGLHRLLAAACCWRVIRVTVTRPASRS